MICPVCGCQQRKTASCVQCHAPLQEKPAKVSEPELDLDLDLELDTHPSRMEDTPSPLNEDTPRSNAAPEIKKPTFEKKSEPKETSPPVSTNRNISKATTNESGDASILIATTQRIEGKRIGAYYGLVHAESLIESDAATIPAAHDLKKGVNQALNVLREEAVRMKANAIVATTFDYHRIDTKNILVSAVGTAVLLKSR